MEAAREASLDEGKVSGMMVDEFTLRNRKATCTECGYTGTLHGLSQHVCETEARGYCEDYPACGHTPADPCTRQWYDEPDAFDTTVHPHALCEHEAGICEVDDVDDDIVDDDYGYRWEKHRVVEARRLPNSRNGNPRVEWLLVGGYRVTSEPDAGWVYGLPGSLYAGMVVQVRFINGHVAGMKLEDES